MYMPTNAVRPIFVSGSEARVRGILDFRIVLAASAALIGTSVPTAAFAQSTPTPSTLVSVCSGVSLPPSVVTGIMDPVLTGIYGPIETNVNQTLGVLTNPLLGLLGLPGNLSVDVNGLLTTAAAGSDIGLNVLAQDGTLVGPSDQCDASADSFTLDNPAGIAIGGNQITGLGDTGEQAVAGEIDSIAIGNRASTDAAALGSIAIGTDASVGAGGVGSVALGNGASATAANSVALGAGSIADRADSVSVGAVGAERQITNVADATQGTDAVNLNQLNAVAATIPTNAVEYDDVTQATITLGGAGGTTITNVADGALDATSTDAVNGSQLYATNQQVDANTTAITNLSADVANNTTAITNLSVDVTNNATAITNLENDIANGAIGPVQYSDPGTPTVPNGGTPTNDLTLVGAAPGPVGLHNVADGIIAAGSTDAVNGGQIYNLSLGIANAVVYETDGLGNRTNNVQLIGGDPTQPVTISGVAPGAVNATSTQAVNGAQLFTVQTTADEALALGENSVQYDNAGHTSVTFNPGGTAAVLSNVAAGVATTDAVNVGQLNSAVGNVVNIANAYTDARIAELDFNLGKSNRDARAGTAAAMALAGMPQSMEEGRSMIGAGFGTYRGKVGFSLGGSYRAPDGKSVYKLGISYDSSSHVGANAGVGYQF